MSGGPLPSRRMRTLMSRTLCRCSSIPSPLTLSHANLLVPRTRSSHCRAASPIANFGFKRGTRSIILASVPLIPKFASEGCRQTLRTSESGHWSIMAAYGLYSHIRANRIRSGFLLVGLFLLVYILTYAGALVGEAFLGDASIDWLLRAAWRDFIMAVPFVTIGTALWILIAYKFHQAMIDAVTDGRDVTRMDEPRLYNLLENLCISRGIPMPHLKVVDSTALNAFATGLNPRQYAISVTQGLLDQLDDAEIEAVLGHELTHIRNGDVRMMVIAVIIAGVISFFAELFFRVVFRSSFRWGDRRSSHDRKGW